MTEEVFDNIGHLYCGNCKFFGHENNNPCRRRIDHENIKFVVPWFKSYDCHQSSGCICSDFEPSNTYPYAQSVWRGFEDYWAWYKEECIPYGNTDILTYFTLNGDTTVRYGVRLMDFINGTMYDGKILKAVEKMYYKRHPVSEKCVTGYELVREKIDGITINGGVKEMAGKIIIEAADVWDYFRWHKEELRNATKVIAERSDFGVEIWLTADDDLPLITVMVDDDEVDSEIALNEKDCYETVQRMYKEYLSDDFLNKMIDDAEGYTASEQLDMIDEREMEIDDAIYSMLDVLIQNLDDITSDPDALCEEVKEHICEYLHRELDISIFRPMYLEDEDGAEAFFEFPYDEMEFDD